MAACAPAARSAALMCLAVKRVWIVLGEGGGVDMRLPALALGGESTALGKRMHRQASTRSRLQIRA
jgi:hypothetical protein